MPAPYSRRRWKRFLNRVEKHARRRDVYGRTLNGFWDTRDRMAVLIVR